MIWTLLISAATAAWPLTPSALVSNSAVVRDWIVGGGDLNGDGYDDVWLPGSASVDLRLGGPTGVSTAVAFSVTPRPYPVGVGDINGDRVDDVVLSSNGTTWDVYRGVANGLPALWATIPAAATSVQVGDLDGDGYADMLFPTATGYALWRGGAVAPVGPVANVDLGASLGETSWRYAVGGDADGDVRGDLLVTHATCAGVLRTDLWWHRGLPLGPARTPSWRWSTAHNDCFGWNPNETGAEPARVTWIGDTNGDGFDDVGRERGGVSATLLGGPTGFGDPVELPVGQLTQRGPAQRLVGVGDFNGDGFDDVAARLLARADPHPRVHLVATVRAGVLGRRAAR